MQHGPLFFSALQSKDSSGSSSDDERRRSDVDMDDASMVASNLAKIRQHREQEVTESLYQLLLS